MKMTLKEAFLKNTCEFAAACAKVDLEKLKKKLEELKKKK